MKRMNFPGRKEKRRQEAEERQKEYEKLSLAEKLDRAGKKQKTKLLLSQKSL